LPSEGGHADFAPTTDEEIELLRYLRARFGGHVSYERVLSGDGIGDLYGFVRERTGEREPTWLAQAIAAGDRNAAISKAALEHKDAACVRALELFAEILGAEAGNVALRSVATGGVVIGGGIPPKVLPVLQAGALIRRFNDKGRFSNWTRTLGVRVTLEPRAALLGAAHYVATSKR
jgi:glucokinase